MVRESDLMLCDMCGALNTYLSIQCWKCGYFFSEADYILNIGTRAYQGKELEEKIKEYEKYGQNDYP